MSYLLEAIIFLIVLFLYIHISYHSITSNDPEIYELNEVSKDKLEEICSLKQPVIINANIMMLPINILEEKNDSFKTNDVLIRNTNSESNELMYLPLNYEKSQKLFKNDKGSEYYSENNETFIKDTALLKRLQEKDKFFRPPLHSNCFYDMLFGSNGSYTPLRYDLNYRNYIYASSGDCNIKLVAPSYNENLHPIMDYVNFEFRSSINIWNVQDEFKNDFSRLKVIDIKLLEGQTIFIPPYWYYSIKFQDNNKVLSLKYRNYFNIFSIIPYLGMHYLQMNNIKNEKFKKIDLSDKYLENTEEVSKENKEEKSIENIKMEIKEK